MDQSQSESAGALSDYDQHPGDSASQTFQRARDELIEASLEAEIGEIDDALGRIESGEYRRCERCGKPISDERLEALPATRYCRVHAPGATAEHGSSTR